MASVSITFRTLKGSTFKIDAVPSDTILDLKHKVAEQQKLNVDNHAAYRLIYKGKILNDEATVSSSSITDQGFVVVMPPKKQVAKPVKPAPAPAPAPVPAPASTAPATAPAATSSTSTATADVQTNTARAPASTSASAPSSAAPSTPGDSLVMGAAYEASVKQIMEMGFPEEQVKRAMRAAYNNPDRAVDYIFNGIPDMPEAPQGAPASTTTPSTAAATNPTSTNPSTTPATAHAPTPNNASRDVPGTPFNMFEPAPTAAAQRSQGSPTDQAAPTSADLEMLRNSPQFMMMRRIIQANPAVLPQILQQLESVNPALVALIEANQEEFSRMLNEPLPEDDDVSDEAMEQLSQMMANSGGPGGPGGSGPGPNQIYVTEEENQQIMRLTELGATIGLERAHVLETWLACNRDENSAANFLVDHAEELRADQAEENAANAERRNQPDDQEGPGGPPA